MTPERARKRIEDLERASREAATLARALSLSVRIEPELVRSMRLALFPESDAGLEAQVWFSDLVEARNPRAMKFFSEVIALYREEWSDHPALLQQCILVTREVHANAPALIRLEEEIGWLALQGDPDDQASRHFKRILVSMVDQNRTGIAQWAVQALPRLPASVRDGEMAKALHLGARARVGLPAFMDTSPAPVISSELREWVMPKDVATIDFYLRLTKGNLEISPISLPGAKHLALPQTSPLAVRLAWTAPEPKTPDRPVVLSRTESMFIPVPEGEIRLFDGFGQEYVLAPLSEAQVFRNKIAPYTVSVLDSNGEAFAVAWIVEGRYAVCGALPVRMVEMPEAGVSAEPIRHDVALRFDLLPGQQTISAGVMASYPPGRPLTGSFEEATPNTWWLLGLNEPPPLAASPLIAKRTLPSTTAIVEALTNPLSHLRGSPIRFASDVPRYSTNDFWLQAPPGRDSETSLGWINVPIANRETGFIYGVCRASASHPGMFELDLLPDLWEAFPDTFNKPGIVLLSSCDLDRGSREELRINLGRVMPESAVIDLEYMALGSAISGEITRVIRDTSVLVVLDSSSYRTSEWFSRDLDYAEAYRWPVVWLTLQEAGPLPEMISGIKMAHYMQIPLNTLAATDRAATLSDAAAIIRRVAMWPRESVNSQSEPTAQAYPITDFSRWIRDCQHWTLGREVLGIGPTLLDYRGTYAWDPTPLPNKFHISFTVQHLEPNSHFRLALFAETPYAAYSTGEFIYLETSPDQGDFRAYHVNHGSVEELHPSPGLDKFRARRTLNYVIVGDLENGLRVLVDDHVVFDIPRQQIARLSHADGPFYWGCGTTSGNIDIRRFYMETSDKNVSEKRDDFSNWRQTSDVWTAEPGRLRLIAPGSAGFHIWNPESLLLPANIRFNIRFSRSGENGDIPIDFRISISESPETTSRRGSSIQLLCPWEGKEKRFRADHLVDGMDYHLEQLDVNVELQFDVVYEYRVDLGGVFTVHIDGQLVLLQERIPEVLGEWERGSGYFGFSSAGGAFEITNLTITPRESSHSSVA